MNDWKIGDDIVFCLRLVQKSDEITKKLELEFLRDKIDELIRSYGFSVMQWGTFETFSKAVMQENEYIKRNNDG